MGERVGLFSSTVGESTAVGPLRSQYDMPTRILPYCAPARAPLPCARPAPRQPAGDGLGCAAPRASCQRTAAAAPRELPTGAAAPRELQKAAAALRELQQATAVPHQLPKAAAPRAFAAPRLDAPRHDAPRLDALAASRAVDRRAVAVAAAVPSSPPPPLPSPLPSPPPSPRLDREVEGSPGSLRLRSWGGISAREGRTRLRRG